MLLSVALGERAIGQTFKDSAHFANWTGKSPRKFMGKVYGDR